MLRGAQFALVPLLIGLLGLVACGQTTAAPPRSTPSQPATVAGASVPARVASSSAVASASSHQSAARTIDGCALVTQTKAVAAAELPLPRVHPSTDADAPGCVYEEADPYGVSVTVAVVLSGGKRSFDDTGASIGSARLDVAGVGDGAFIVPGLQMLYALKGDTLLRIQLANPFLSDADYRAHLTTLGQVAIGRL
jgi:hypothetical protein